MMPKPKRGEVWLVRFPFTDLTSTKLRPSLVVAIHGEDVIVVGIFSRISTGTLRKTWVRIDDQHSAFRQTGLKKASLLRAEKVTIVHESVFQQKLGKLPLDLMAEVQVALKRALLLS